MRESRAWRMFWRQPGSRLLTTVLSGVVGLALLAPLLPLESPDRQFTNAAYQPPSFTADQEDGGFFLRGHALTGRVTEGLWPWDRALNSIRESILGDRVWPPWFRRDSLGRCVLSRII